MFAGFVVAVFPPHFSAFFHFRAQFQLLTTKHCIPSTPLSESPLKIVYLIVSLQFLFVQVVRFVFFFFLNSMVRCTIFIWNIQYDACVSDYSVFFYTYIDTNICMDVLCVCVLQGHAATFSPIMLRISIISHEQVYCTAAAAAATTFTCHSF